MNPEQYFTPQESRELYSLGVQPDAAWHIKRPVVGWEYGPEETRLISLTEVKPHHERFRNERFEPAILIPE